LAGLSGIFLSLELFCGWLAASILNFGIFDAEVKMAWHGMAWLVISQLSRIELKLLVFTGEFLWIGLSCLKLATCLVLLTGFILVNKLGELNVCLALGVDVVLTSKFLICLGKVFFTHSLHKSVFFLNFYLQQVLANGH
jgi:hypothetical protein